MVSAAGVVVVVVFFLVAFAGSTLLAAVPLRREVARAVRRGEALPRIALWWRVVLARAWWLLGGGVVLVAGGAFAWARGGSEAALWAALLGLGLAAYVVQAAYLVRVVNRTIERTPRERPEARS